MPRRSGPALQRLLRALCLLALGGLLSAGHSLPAESAESESPPSLLAGCEIDYPPFCFMNSEGQADGFSVELLRATLSAMGRKVSFAVSTWSEVKQSLAVGRLQALPRVERTPEREEAFDFTFPYLSLHGTLVVRKDETEIHDLADLCGREVAVLEGDNAEEFLRRGDFGATIVTAPSFTAALQELSEGRHDAVLIQKLLAVRLLHEGGFDNLRCVGQPVESFRQDFCFAVREGDKERLALLNEGLSLVMADGTFRKLQRRWFAAPDASTKSRIVVGGDRDYPPYEYLDANGQPAGYNIELTRAIARQIGVEVSFRLGPWASIRHGLQEGEIDLLQGMFYSPERDKLLDFSQAHTVVQHVAVVRKDGPPPPSTLEQLAGLRLVVQQRDIMHDYAIEHGLEGKLTLVESQEEALRQLAAGEYDCALVAKLPALYWIKKNGEPQLRVGEKPLLAPEYCYAALPENHALLVRFGEGLADLEAMSEYRKIYNKYLGVYEKPLLTFWSVSRYVAIALVPVLLLLVAALVWSRTLQRRVAERTAELRRSQEQFRGVFESAMVGIALHEILRDPTGQACDYRLLEVNPAFEAITGIPREQARGALASALYGMGEAPFLERYEEVARTGTAVDFEAPFEPMKKIFRISAFSFAPDRFATIFEDVTERRHMQDRLRHTEKMEAIGQLAGGVAHDFNNQLAGIMGYGDLLASRLQDPVLKRYADNILVGARRAADLTKQLLAFARKGQYESLPVDVHKTVGEVVAILSHTIDRRITIQQILKANPPLTTGDPSQLQSAILNLALNARDAMPEGGELVFATDTVELDDAYCRTVPYEIRPGRYLRLSVTDSGCGMDAETRKRLFEPFFTTKGPGKGTGMGLAAVYGTVKNHRGAISVYSEPDHGSTFRLYLPLAAGTTFSLEADPEENAAAEHTTARILVVDDEEIFRSMAADMLAPLGHAVTAKSDGLEGVEYFRQHWREIDLVILDMIMPQLDGRGAFRAMKAIHPGVRVLLASGYSINGAAQGLLAEGVMGFLQKPFSQRELEAAVRELLNAPGEPPPAQ